MTPAPDITIPPEAIEAAARAIWASCQSGTLAWEDLPRSTRKAITEEARAACLAMLRSWPEMVVCTYPVRTGRIILPLPSEKEKSE